MSCGIADWGCSITDQLGEWAETAAGQTITALAEAVAESVSDTLVSLGTAWVRIPTPVLSTAESEAIESSPPVDEGFVTLLGWVTWVGLAVCIFSLVALGASIAWSRHGGGIHGAMTRLITVLGAAILIGAGSALVTSLLARDTSWGSGPVAYIQSSLNGYTAGMVVLSITIGAIAMAWQQRSAPGRELLRSLITLVVVSGAGLAGIQLAVTAADALAQIVLSNATEGTDFSTNLMGLIGLTNAVTGGMGSLAVILLGGMALLASIAQIVMLVVRGGMLILLAGVLPLAASFTNTDVGRAWFRKCAIWILAFILYKPAAAVIYATAFQLVGSDVTAGTTKDTLVTVLSGVAMMIIAILALPALMRFLTPLVVGVAGGSGISTAIAHAGSASLPTGAKATGGRSPSVSSPGANATVSAPDGARSTGPAKSSPGGAFSGVPNRSGAMTSVRTTASDSSLAAVAGPAALVTASGNAIARGSSEAKRSATRIGEDAGTANPE